MYTEDDLLPISALQHLLYCERQCALIHIERVWEENQFTAEGRILHEKVDSGTDCMRSGRRIARSLPLRSLQLGLTGLADVVEFGPGKQDVFPIEYKRGRKKAANWDRIQLCAQALCLEEMLGHRIDNGALFYGKTRRRQDVAINDELREETAQMAHRLHALFDARVTPRPVFDKRCPSCSFFSYCLPETLSGKKSAGRYLDAIREGK